MKDRAINMAKQGMDLYEAYTQPAIERNNFQLLELLKSQGVSIEQLVQEHQNSKENFRLIEDFAKLLPKTDSASFTVQDPLLLRHIQIYAVWVEKQVGVRMFERNTSNVRYMVEKPVFGWRPYYIMGRKGRGRNTSLLLASAGAQEELIEFTPTKSALSRVKKMSRLERSEHPTSEVVRQVFNEEVRSLVFNQDSPGSTKIRQRSIRVPLWPGMPMSSITDEQMALYDVNSYMQRIARDFSLSQNLQYLYDVHAERVAQIY